MSIYLQKQLNLLRKNAEQFEAYNCTNSCAVTAGPGSGKTAVLTLKMMKLLNEDISAPRGAACITYSNEAVNEFRGRFKKLGLRPRPNVFLGTLHSFCLTHILTPFCQHYLPEVPHPLTIASNEIVSVCRAKAKDKLPTARLPWDVENEYLNVRRKILDRSSPAWHQDPQCAMYIREYERQLRNHGCIDFDDQVLLSLNIIDQVDYVRRSLEAKFPWILIDEYQDLGHPLHHLVITLLNQTEIKIFGVGDPDQSIYDFQGADPTYFNIFSSNELVKPVSLSLNYRCGQKIINAASCALPTENAEIQSCSRGDADPGEVYFWDKPGGLSEQSEYIATQIIPGMIEEGVQLKEIAILYLDKYDLGVIQPELDKFEIQYSGEKDLRYDRSPLIRWLERIALWSCKGPTESGILFKDLFQDWQKYKTTSLEASLRHEQLTNFYETIAELSLPKISLIDWLTQLNKTLEITKILLEKRSYEQAKFSLLLKNAEAGGKLASYNLENFAGCGANLNKLCLTTLHGSKGHQFDAVIIPGLEEGRIPRYDNTPTQTENQRRLFYVGITRARKYVHLLYSGWYRTPRSTFKQGPSCFVTELQKLIVE
ncbi:ATP-dependent helicase [Desulfovibrio oxyclinae]|uniref:ATP-dependent helicase n=1 Tax=Desulfovibrio oxyclinae TaxID=63560 RepID=UPI0003A796DB|nr:ATP-dependent helicase [Desulfovibrio oxyclinae]